MTKTTRAELEAFCKTHKIPVGTNDAMIRSVMAAYETLLNQNAELEFELDMLKYEQEREEEQDDK